MHPPSIRVLRAHYELRQRGIVPTYRQLAEDADVSMSAAREHVKRRRLRVRRERNPGNRESTLSVDGYINSKERHNRW